MMRIPRRTAAALAASSLLALTGLSAVAGAVTATADERTAALVGSLQSELGCGSDWDPACAATELQPTGDGTYTAEFDVPAGTYEYKVALNDAWDESYGRDGGSNNAPLVLAGDARVRVTYDDTTHRIALTPLGLAGEYDEAADAGLVLPPVRQPGSDERFYFVMTDRFANGDPSNDTAGIEGGPLDHGFDPTNKGFYHGGDIAGLRSNLDYIEGMGTTAIWLTPSFLNRPVQGTGANASSGYHGYWITDFTQIDPHLGTNAELEALIADAHARGIKVYFDIITNHTADVIDYAEGTHSYVEKATEPYRDAAGNVFDPDDYAGTGEFPALDPATSFPYTPVVAPEDADVKVPDWLNDVTLYHNRGDSTWSGESVTYGDFVGLDDLMTEHPTVVQGFVDVYKAWVDLGIDGFRIDTVKHVNPEFWETWSAEVMDYAHSIGKDDFFMFGEVFDADSAKTAPYVRDTEMSSVLDFAFQASATSYAGGNSARGLASLFASDDRYITPDSSPAALPTFLGNHDMGRVGYMLASTDAPLARDELAHELMYLTRGQPVVYYGDEQGFAGAGGDKDARQTLFATQVDEYANQNLVTGERAGSVDRYDTQAPLYRHIAALAELREAHPALATGAQVERYAENGAGVYAFSRVDRTDKVEHLVALNNASQARQATFTTLTPGAQYSVLYGELGGGATTLTAGADGTVTLTVPATSAVVLVADRTVDAETSGDVSVTVPAAGAAITGSVPVAATVDDAWAETSFAWREVGTGEWHHLGTAEDTTPRVFHDVELPEGTLVEYRAVTVDADGDRAAASTFASVGVDVSGVVGDVEPEPEIDMVTVPGTHNSEMGCTGDWTPDCEGARLTQRPDGVWQGTFDLPAGDYEYKVAINGSWAVNYGRGGVRDGANTTYSHAGGPVTFYWDPVSHDFSSTAQGPIVTLPGSYQDQVGCPGNWAPDCLATWMKDPDQDGVFTWSTSELAAGAYEVKVAHGMSWAENYGVGGARDGANYSFSVGDGEQVTFTYDIDTHVLGIGVENPPLPGAGQQAAHWVREGLLLWPGSLGSGDAWTLWTAPEGGLAVAGGAVRGPDGGELPEGAASYTLEPASGGVPADVAADFPALASHTALALVGEDGEPLDRSVVESLLTGQLLVTRSAGEELTAATGVQVPGVLDDLYGEAAADRTLGVQRHPSGKWASFALWAPTAKDVDVLVWPAGADLASEPRRFDAERQADGAWTLDGKAADKKYAWDGARYRYAVQVYVPSTGKVETNVVTDPYSVGLTLDSTHSVVLGLDDKRWQPKVWRTTPQPVVERSVDQTIYELHVRDFSITDETVPEGVRGTYLAFAEAGSDGMTHLRELAEAGMTTVHLLPTFDIASIIEDPAKRSEPGDLSGFAPDSTEQQAAVTAVKEKDGFNWGYDPYHFSVPEGSYAVRADGGARVAEFRTMVGSLHRAGLQVVLDQVFNHTAASGQAEKSVLDKVVPGYYHRLNTTTGAVETSTCCQNVATEHSMAEKLMVDSVVTWARDYKVDGFRFDLMGHHSRDNMLAVRAALDELTVEEDGVDGSAVYLYGEGWNFGEVANNALFTQATQGQLGGTGIGTFSDRLRDAVHGGSPVDGASTFTQGFGTGLFTAPNGKEARTGEPGTVNDGSEDELADLRHQTDLVRLGLAGNLRDYELLAADGQVKRGEELDYRGSPAGYADSPEEVVTYVDAHDNETLFDLLTLKLPEGTPMDERVRMNTVSLATTALAQTPSFWHAGTDLLRSKSLDRNSYDSGDWFNAIDWSGQDNGFGRGLPLAADNQGKWPVMRPLLANPALKPTPQHIATASEQARDLLELRFSTELFRLGSAPLIQEKVSFPGAGPDAVPGVVAMSIDDTAGGTDVDPALDGVLAVFNASPEPATLELSGLAGRDYALSPVQQDGSDAVVRGTAWDEESGTVTVPARTVAVLVDPQG